MEKGLKTLLYGGIAAVFAITAILSLLWLVAIGGVSALGIVTALVDPAALDSDLLTQGCGYICMGVVGLGVSITGFMVFLKRL